LSSCAVVGRSLGSLWSILAKKVRAPSDRVGGSLTCREKGEVTRE